MNPQGTLLGDDGDDLLRDGMGNDTLTGDNFSGGRGVDTFVLAMGEGTDTIVDFEVGTDLLGLSGGLSLAQLTFVGSEIRAGAEVLATLNHARDSGSDGSKLHRDRLIF